MAANTIEVLGIDKAIKLMNRYDKQVAKTIDTEAKKLVLNIAADAQRAAPVDTGFLRANIVTVVRRFFYEALSMADYSIFVDRRKPYFTAQALRKIAKFIPKVKSIIKGL